MNKMNGCSDQNICIVDSQVHIWSGGIPTPAHRQQPFTKEQLLEEMRLACVNRAIIVPTSWDPEGNQTAINAARSHPDRFAVMALVSLNKSDTHPLMIRDEKTKPIFGARLFFGAPHAAEKLTNGSADWFWPAAENASLPLMIHSGTMLSSIAKIAEKHPGLPICIDSMGCIPRMTDGEAFAQLPQLLALSRLPNVSVKAEAAAMFSSDAYPFKNIHPYLKQIFDTYGPHRLFWGSDLTRSKISYKQSIDFFNQELNFLSDKDRRLIMGEAICKWIGWPL